MAKWPHNLVLVRHGESEYNLERRLIALGETDGHSNGLKLTRNADIVLTQEGIKQARATGDFLHKHYKKFDVVFVSPFKRADETAEHILGAWQTDMPPIMVDERLREKEFGIFFALTEREIKDRYPEWALLRSIEGRYYFRPPGGESYPDVAIRVRSFLATIVRDWAGKNVLIVSHAAVLLAFHKILARMSERAILELVESAEIKNCAMITYKPGMVAGTEREELVPQAFNTIAY
jgi:broad specificity phosphatase PhoE